MTKYIIAAAVLFSATAMSTEANAQFAQNTNGGAEWTVEPPKMSNSGTDIDLFTDSRPPAYAPPPEGGDGQKLGPISEGLWVLIGLAMTYGIIRRKQRVKDMY